MGRRDELIETYAADLKKRTGNDSDPELLRAVTVAAGPSIYNRDAAFVAASDGEELDRICKNFLMKKLGVADRETAMGALQKVIRDYDRSSPRKHRVSIYYMLVKHFGKEHVFV